MTINFLQDCSNEADHSAVGVGKIISTHSTVTYRCEWNIGLPMGYMEDNLTSADNQWIPSRAAAPSKGTGLLKVFTGIGIEKMEVENQIWRIKRNQNPPPLCCFRHFSHFRPTTVLCVRFL